MEVFKNMGKKKTAIIEHIFPAFHFWIKYFSGSRGRRSKHSCSDFTLPWYHLQVFLGMFPSQLRVRVCADSAPGSYPLWTCLKNLTNEALRWHPTKISKWFWMHRSNIQKFESDIGPILTQRLARGDLFSSFPYWPMFTKRVCSSTSVTSRRVNIILRSWWCHSLYATWPKRWL